MRIPVGEYRVSPHPHAIGILIRETAMRVALSLLAAAFLAGCTHSSVMQVSGDTLQISSAGAMICGSTGTLTVANRRAAIETINHGFDRYVVLGAEATNNIGVVGYTPSTANTNSSATVYGDRNFATGYGQSQTTFSGGQPIYGGHNNQDIFIKMFRANDPNGANAIDARQALGPEWRNWINSSAVGICAG